MFNKGNLFTWWNMPAVGPMREYQERTAALMRSWIKLQKAGLFYAGLGTPFAMNYITGLTEYCRPWLSKEQKWAKEFDRYMQYLDQCWDKVMRTDDYARKSADLMHAMLEFRQNLEKCWALCTDFVPMPFPDKKEMEQMEQRLQELQQKLDELVEKQSHNETAAAG